MFCSVMFQNVCFFKAIFNFCNTKRLFVNFINFSYVLENMKLIIECLKFETFKMLKTYLVVENEKSSYKA